MTISVEEPQVSEGIADAVGTTVPDPTRKTAPVEEYASFDDLLTKPARERDLTINIGTRTLKLHLRAIGSLAYDQLVASCPPSPEDRDRGAVFDLKTFAPKLISACVTRPKMDLDQASRLWADPNWAGGESGGLYRACVELCQAGLDVPFSGSG